jgi:hypothetical protein
MLFFTTESLKIKKTLRKFNKAAKYGDGYKNVSIHVFAKIVGSSVENYRLTFCETLPNFLKH